MKNILFSVGWLVISGVFYLIQGDSSVGGWSCLILSQLWLGVNELKRNN